MTRRHTPYHRYKSPAAAPPAGFRFADYIPKRCFNMFQGPNFTDHGSPDPSPLNSPVKDLRDLKDLSSAHFPGYYPRDPPRAPVRPPTPTLPPRRHAAPPNATHAKDPLPYPPRRRKVRRGGPKHLSFRNDARRPGDMPSHRGSQRLKEKREAFRKKFRNRSERRVSRSLKTIDSLRKEAEALMKPERMDDEDRIFLEQLSNMDFNQRMDDDLEGYRDHMARAANESEERHREHEKMDGEAEELWERGEEDAEGEQKRLVKEFMQREDEKEEAHYRRVEEEAMRADEERQRAHEATERKIREVQERVYREELARKAKEEEEVRQWEETVRQLREQVERLQRERRERWNRETADHLRRARQLREEAQRVRREAFERRRQEEAERVRLEELERLRREEAERLRQEEAERLRQEEAERLRREEAERLRREAHERFLHQERERLAREERERQARSSAEKEQVCQYFAIYEGKWAELRTNEFLPPIDVREMPWPVFGVVSRADEITYQGVRAFLFHPFRPGVEGKSARDKVKSEVLRFHPDKFNTRIVPKIREDQQGTAQEIAGAVARILTTIMTEEGGQK